MEYTYVNIFNILIALCMHCAIINFMSNRYVVASQLLAYSKFWLAPTHNPLILLSLTVHGKLYYLLQRYILRLN